MSFHIHRGKSLCIPLVIICIKSYVLALLLWKKRSDTNSNSDLWFSHGVWAFLVALEWNKIEVCNPSKKLTVTNSVQTIFVFRTHSTSDVLAKTSTRQSSTTHLHVYSQWRLYNPFTPSTRMQAECFLWQCVVCPMAENGRQVLVTIGRWEFGA